MSEVKNSYKTVFAIFSLTQTALVIIFPLSPIFSSIVTWRAVCLKSHWLVDLLFLLAKTLNSELIGSCAGQLQI